MTTEPDGAVDADDAGDRRRSSFEAFVVAAEGRVRRALTMAAGPDAAREATADALVEVWRRWDRVEPMDNPTGYLYTVARRRLPRRPSITIVELTDRLAMHDGEHTVEPRLLTALRALPERQRIAAYLVVGCGWTAPEVGELIGVSATTVRTHLDRAMARLRSDLGATEDPT